MPSRDLNPDHLTERLAALDRAIELKLFECDCVDALGHRELAHSDLGWIMSIIAGAAGTTTAVWHGKRFSRESDRLMALHEELQALRTEREVIETLLIGA